MNELVLVVDDEPKIAKLAQDFLQQGGFRVATAGDGKAALDSFRRARPDLIVLDLRLPDMDGLDVCRTVRRDSDVPIIMPTARADEADRLVGLELGADDYITKPFSPRELVARVRAVSGARRAAWPVGRACSAWATSKSTSRGTVRACVACPCASHPLNSTYSPRWRAGRGRRCRGRNSRPGVRRSLRGRRPQYRQPHQEFTKEDRAGALNPEVHPDGLWHRLQIRGRGLSMHGWSHGDADDWPPWMGRGRMTWRMKGGGHRLSLGFAFMFGLMALLVFGGMAAAAFVLTRMAGCPGHPPRSYGSWGSALRSHSRSSPSRYARSAASPCRLPTSWLLRMRSPMAT